MRVAHIEYFTFDGNFSRELSVRRETLMEDGIEIYIMDYDMITGEENLNSEMIVQIKDIIGAENAESLKRMCAGIHAFIEQKVSLPKLRVISIVCHEYFKTGIEFFPINVIKLPFKRKAIFVRKYVHDIAEIKSIIRDYYKNDKFTEEYLEGKLSEDTLDMLILSAL